MDSLYSSRVPLQVKNREVLVSGLREERERKGNLVAKVINLLELLIGLKVFTAVLQQVTQFE